MPEALVSNRKQAPDGFESWLWKKNREKTWKALALAQAVMTLIERNGARRSLFARSVHMFFERNAPEGAFFAGSACSLETFCQRQV